MPRPQTPNQSQQPSGANIGPVTPAPATSGTLPAGQLPPPPPYIFLFIDPGLLTGTIPPAAPTNTGQPTQRGTQGNFPR